MTSFEEKFDIIIRVLLALLILFANIVLAYAVFKPSVFSRTYNVFIERAVVDEMEYEDRQEQRRKEKKDD